MLSGSERIDRKAKLLDRLDPEGLVALEDAFTNHVADAIRASSPREREQEIDNALEAYEEALDGALHEILDKHFANGDSSVA